VIVRWGIGGLAEVLGELGVSSPLAIRSGRWGGLDADVAPVAVWEEVPSHRIDDVVAAARDAGVDVVVAVGGGSAIDLGKPVSAELNVPLVSIPTTYSGAEWTAGYGVRDPEKKLRGAGAGASPAGIVYVPELTLGLPAETTVGTAMNALAHCAEALYARGRNDDADAHALSGARLIAEWLPQVVERPEELEARTRLLEGAAEAGAALAGAGLALAHAMAQAVGGAYGLPHGTLNGICLPPALRFNLEAAPEPVRRFADAIGSDDPVRRVEQLAALAGPTRLRDLGVPESDLAELGRAAAERPGNAANPVQATPEQVEELLRSVW
jgi:maleylacetate reductase